MVVPGALFEEMGFSYFGPIPGHDLGALLTILNHVKELDEPVLLHVVTQKGKGYKTAEDAPDKLHSIGGMITKASKKAPSYTSVFANTLIALARTDDRIVAVTAAMPSGTGLNKFAEVFPDRCFDVGIAEQHAATLCAGLATAGMRPVFAVYSTFLQRAYDQVIHDICIQNLPVTFAIDRAGLVGPDGETHQGVFDIAFLRTVPNITLMMPKDEGELRHMLHTALTLTGPAAVRYPREDGVGAPLDVPLEVLPIGRSETVREGRDIAFLAVGPMVAVAENAALMLAEQSIFARVVNVRFLKPIDEHLLSQLAQDGIPVVTVEEATVKGGFGAAVLEYYANNDLVHPVHPMGLPDQFITHGSRPELLHYVGLTAKGLSDVAFDLLAKLPKHKVRRKSVNA